LPRLRTIEDLGELDGRRVLCRVDFNVPLEAGRVADDFRIRQTVPTLDRLRSDGAALILASHLGRPGGTADDGLRLDPVAASLEEVWGRPVRKLDEVIGDDVTEACRSLGPGDALMLENLRFEPGEEENNPGFADALGSLGDVYVNDAFGASHRDHASVVGVPERIPGGAGDLMAGEVDALGRLLEDPESPFVAILGGAKVSDKLEVVAALTERVDALLIGGAMAFTFLAAQGGEVGDSPVEEDRLEDVRSALKAADARGIPLILPEDVVAAPEAAADVRAETVPADHVPKGLAGLDVGPRTVEEFTRILADARTVFWNGPMGVVELERFAVGTRGVAQAVAAIDAFTVVGGGDSVAAIRRLGFEDAVDHLSTGGGASLEFLEGRDLPGVAILRER
jgi:phosphoglycerate kinase